MTSKKTADRAIGAVSRKRAVGAPSKARAGNAAALARTGAELGLAVPAVVAHRVARMALAGPVPSARDRREFAGMWLEKGQALAQGWQAMAAATLRTQQSMAGDWFGALRQVAGARSPWQAWSGWAALARRQHDAQLAVVQAGLTPMRRKAVANAKRLRGTPLR